MSVETATFDIREHLEKLESAKGGRYVCPRCQRHNLTVNRESGAYQCWNGCECKDIRDAIAPLPERRESPHRHTYKGKPSGKPKISSPSNVSFHLARLSVPATDRPTLHRDFDREHGEILKTTYVYALTEDGQLQRWVVRTEWPDSSKGKGKAKTFRQWHRSSSGEAVCKKGDAPWEAYRIAEFLQALKATPEIPVGLVLEGEGCVEVSRANGLAAVTFQGSAWKPDDLERSLDRIKLECPNAVLAYLKDNDATGEKKARDFQESCDKVGIFSIVINPLAIHSKLPDAGDIVEILAAMDASEFIRRLEEEIHQAIEARHQNSPVLVDVPEDFDPDKEFTQQARRDLYGDKPWICVDGTLHYWTGTYYKTSPDVVEIQRLWRYCNGYAVADSKGDVRYPYATPSWVKRLLEWVKQAYGVDPALVDPPGTNCTNGVLQLTWNGPKVSWRLVDHDPALYYTYEPITPYDPDADPKNCDRLLEVLDAPQREIFLRTTAASLDLATVRRHKGRLVRALLLKGHGSNGKDTLRECVAAMYGYRGMTGATLTDFKSYDEGRKFPLARLNRSRVNWASENANTAKLDRIQSLKAFITGDTISIEGKGKNEYDFTPVGVGLFNVNDTPDLQASLEAIQSRYGVLTFSKTFKIGADPLKGELEADPRFKYDPDFLRSEVLPAFLNRVLEALTRLMAEGIDYSSTQQALEDIQAENSHLFQFCQDTGLSYAPDQKLTAGEIWERLEQWYCDNGTLSYQETSPGKQKAIWVDQARKGDANVKGANQVIARFQNLFPKAKRVTFGKGKMALQGISFNPVKPNGEAVYPTGEPVVSQLVSQKPLPDKDGEPVTPVFLFDEKIEISSSNLQQSDRDIEPKDDRSGNLPRLAHHSDTARHTASPIGSPTASPLEETASPLEETASPTAPKPEELAATILKCPTWMAAVAAVDVVAAAVGKDRQTVLKSAVQHIPDLGSRQYLVGLLAEHMRQFPKDHSAYSWLPDSLRKLKEKAIARAGEASP